MGRGFIMAAVGLILGAAATFAAFQHGLVPLRVEPTASPLIQNVPVMNLEAAETHRDSHYASIRSIKDVLALPGDFAQTEALYALAGRSDSAGVQDLIFQANGIMGPSDRKAALEILFSRLTELDVRSALALSRTRDFRAERQIEAGVWHGWGKLDLDAALAGAAALDTVADRNLAAQALFAAYDYQGNETTDYIEETLGIGPDSATLTTYLFRVGDRDPAAAIGMINEMNMPSEQLQAASYLGHRLGRLDGARASRHADFFSNLQTRQIYSNAVSSALAEADPEAVLEELLRDRPTIEQAMQAHGALQAMVSRDLDKAYGYLERIAPNPEQRAMLVSILAPALVQADPERALAWAKEADRGMQSGLYQGVLAAMATTHPESAIAEARQLQNSMQRRQAFSAIAMTLSQDDPNKAIALLDQIDRPDERSDVERNIAMVWIQSDPEAALSWIFEGAGERNSIVPMAAAMVAQQDLDTAMRWLPRFDEESQQVWRAQIATNLALQRSVEEAQSFVARYEGSDDYPQLLASAINGVAQTDIAAAIEMAGRVPAGVERDALYNGLVRQFGHQDPQQAAALLSSIVDDAQRTQATAMLAMVWSHSDPESAQQWAGALPRGDERDDAIMHLTSNWDEMTPSRRLLVNSIGDLEKRKQAFVMHIQRIAQSDPERAESMMGEIDLSEQERLELQQNIDMIRMYP